MKKLTDEEYESFKEKYDGIRARKDKGREEDLLKLYDKMEQDLKYIGVSAIEDKLQDEVADTIATLRKASINIWMLTGDKMETAIEIARSCALFDQGMTELLFSFDDMISITQKLDSEIRYLELKNLFNEKEQISVVVDGSTLEIIFTDGLVTSQFFELCKSSQSVVCCRVSPKQKSDIVEHYMKTEKGICIAVGDGANDVPMIMQSHIGIGIRGMEGTQAVRSADFAVNEFKNIKKLLLVHGRWGYKRIAWMVCYYFYKNIVLALSEIYFALFNGFSGQVFFLDWLPMLYNSVFTSYACVFTLAFEQDGNVENSYKYPVLYGAGQKNKYFNLWVFWKWIILAMWHGVISFWGPIWMGQGINDWTGKTQSHWFNSSTSFTIIVNFVTMKLFIESVFWQWLSIIAAAISLTLYYCVAIIGSTQIAYLMQIEAPGMLWMCISSPKFWIMQLIFPMICLLPDLAYNIIIAVYFPTPAQIIMAEQKGWRAKIHERAAKRAAKRQLSPEEKERRRKKKAEKRRKQREKKRLQKLEGHDVSSSSSSEESEESESEPSESESEVPQQKNRLGVEEAESREKLSSYKQDLEKGLRDEGGLDQTQELDVTKDNLLGEQVSVDQSGDDIDELFENAKKKKRN